MIWRQLNAGRRVWLAGHSKGGAIATLAAARLLLGDSVVDADLTDPSCRRPDDDALSAPGKWLSRLSVITFNAPMGLSITMAAAYERRLAETGAEHVRFEHKSDRIRKLPNDGSFVHVGRRELQGQGLLQDPGVVIGGIIAIAGGLAALVSAGKAIVNNH